MRTIILIFFLLLAVDSFSQLVIVTNNPPATVLFTNSSKTVLSLPFIDVTNGLVSYWPFTNSSFADVVGPNSGTSAGNVTSGIGPNGGANTAANFSGGPQAYLRCGNDASTKITGDVSVSFWISPAFVSGQTYSVMWRVVPVSNVSYWPSTYDGVFIFNSNFYRWERGNNVSSDYDFVTSSPLPANSVWTFICTTSSGTTNTIYYNGVQVAQKIFTATIPYSDNATNLNIGGDGTVSSRLNAILAGVRLYNRALLAGEVSLIYSNGVNRKRF